MPEFEPRRAFEHLDKLAYEIGPRLAGTRGEELAASYVRKQFEGYGLETRSRAFKFVDRRARTKVTACLFAAAFVSTLLLPPLYSLAVWFASLALWRSLGLLMPKRESQNVIARLKRRGAKRRVMITAHLDSAPCVVNEKLHLFLRLAFLPLLLVTTLALIAWQLGLFPWLLAWIPLAAVFLPTCCGMFLAAIGRRISPGANDNASGVAVMLEVARVTTEAPPNAEFLFAALGAEEQGLVGSRELAKEMKGVEVLNLDMLGVGKHTFIVEGNGLVRRHKTSPRLNGLLSLACKRAGVEPKLWWAALAGHDHVSFLRAKVPATTFTIDVLPRRDRLGSFLGRIFRLPNARVRGDRHIHTPEDIPDRIELENVERAGRVVLEFIKSA